MHNIKDLHKILFLAYPYTTPPVAKRSNLGYKIN